MKYLLFLLAAMRSAQKGYKSLIPRLYLEREVDKTLEVLMETDVIMKTYLISRTTLENIRDRVYDPELHIKIATVLESANGSQIRVAIVPDLYEHIALLMVGVNQTPIPLRSVPEIVTELKNSGVIAEVQKLFENQLAQAKANFLEIIA